MKPKRSEKMFKRASKNLVGAVNSPARAFGAVGGKPLFIKQAKGSKITDVDGNEYIDFVLSYGPMILGHGHLYVQRQVRKALKHGYSFGATSAPEIKLAKMICGVFPGMEKIRFVNSGTEAVLSALRLARAYTGKTKIIKFSGCYHGHVDALLVAAGSGLATLSLPGSAGVPESSVQGTLIAHYNDLDSVKAHFETHDDIAGVIIEPIAGNMGVVVPQDNFMKDLQSYVSSQSALLIADEVMSGFRAHYGGTQELLGVQADITCLGKVIGGGFPVGAYGARAEIMDKVAPLGDVYQAGTFSGNPISMSAGIATLRALKRQNPFDTFNETAKTLEDALKQSARRYKVDIAINRYGSMITPFFTKGSVSNFQHAQAADTQRYARFFWAMINNGIFLPPSQFEAWFLSSALTKTDIAKTINAIDIAMQEVARI
ncbi:MAG: glutamate-1-semialdehyde 2,1-aminomutase [Robiginitomaculum sp.]|nr:glutamate-1-semialdehyde 2,1-aminomutase [Robiginitomaculum sp.]